MKWLITKSTTGNRMVVPLCPQHDLRLNPVQPTQRNPYGGNTKGRRSQARQMKCAEGPHFIDIPREFGNQEQYVLDRIDALTFKKMEVLNLDDEAIPVAEKELKDKDSPYWVKAKVTESKSGTRLVIWAGDRLKKNKAQLFVEPEIKKLGFDQNDTHPSDVFAKVEVTFADGVKTKIEKSSK